MKVVALIVALVCAACDSKPRPSLHHSPADNRAWEAPSTEPIRFSLLWYPDRGDCTALLTIKATHEQVQAWYLPPSFCEKQK